LKYQLIQFKTPLVHPRAGVKPYVNTVAIKYLESPHSSGAAVRAEVRDGV